MFHVIPAYLQGPRIGSSREAFSPCPQNLIVSVQDEQGGASRRQERGRLLDNRVDKPHDLSEQAKWDTWSSAHPVFEIGD